jgi:hypothetical protein
MRTFPTTCLALMIIALLAGPAYAQNLTGAGGTVATGGTVSAGVAVTANPDYANITLTTGNSSTSTLRILNSASELFRVQANGNVGIGVTLPGQKLVVGGNIQLSSGGYIYADTTDTNLLISHSQGAILSWNANNYVNVGGNVTRFSTNAGQILKLWDFKTGIGNTNPAAEPMSRLDVGPDSLVQFQDMSTQGVPNGINLKMNLNSQIDVAGIQIGSTGLPIIQSSGSSGLYLQSLGSSSLYLNQTMGSSVVIGSDSHSADLVVKGNLSAGTIFADYQDVAEWVPSAESLPAGTVVVLSDHVANTVTTSTRAYDTGVAGVVSPTPGLLLGIAGPSKAKIATTGRVHVRVDATKGPIRIGDLLVTSDHPGLAMKSEPLDVAGAKIHRPGTLIGKALEPLATGEGQILVLLSLQ